MKDKLFSIKKMIIKSITFSFLVILTGCANEQTYYSKKFATPSCGVYLPNTPYVACKNEVKSGDERTLAKNKFSLSTNHRSTKPIAPSSSENVRPKPRSSSSGFDCAGKSSLLLAAMLDESKFEVSVYDRNAAPGRKFLVAGDGGFNLTHSEEPEHFISRYTPAAFFEKILPSL